MPLLILIGLAPNLIFHHFHLNYHAYIIYQLIALSGLLVSSLSMQFIAGKWQFHQLIRRGCYISFAGIFFSFMSNSSILLLSIGLFFIASA